MKKLRRPTAAAWAVNRAALTAPRRQRRSPTRAGGSRTPRRGRSRAATRTRRGSAPPRRGRTRPDRPRRGRRAGRPGRGRSAQRPVARARGRDAPGGHRRRGPARPRRSGPRRARAVGRDDRRHSDGPAAQARRALRQAPQARARGASSTGSRTSSPTRPIARSVSTLRWSAPRRRCAARSASWPRSSARRPPSSAGLPRRAAEVARSEEADLLHDRLARRVHRRAGRRDRLVGAGCGAAPVPQPAGAGARRASAGAAAV